MSQEKKPAAHSGGTNQTLRDMALEEFASLEKDTGKAGRKKDFRRDLKKYIRTGDAHDFIWHEPYILESLVEMYEVTGNIGYMKTVKEHVDDIFAHRASEKVPRRGIIKDELRKCVMPGWLTGKYKTNGKKYAWLVHQGMITYPIARWVHRVKQDNLLPKLSIKFKRKPQLGEKYLQSIIDSITDIMCHKEFEKQLHKEADGKGIYYDNDLVHKESGETNLLGTALPFNMQNAAGQTFIMLYLITNDTQYRARAEGLAWFFKNRLKLKTGPEGERYDWNYRPGEERSEDTSHAAINVNFACLCYEVGIVFDATDMTRFVNTFRHICQGASGTADIVAGKGLHGKEYGVTYGNTISRWMRLAHFDPSIRPIYWDYYRAFKDKNIAERPEFFPWDKTVMPAMAYLAKTSPPVQDRDMVSIYMGNVDIKDDLFLVEPGNGHTKADSIPDEKKKIKVKVRRTEGDGDYYFYLDVGDNFASTSKIDITIRYYDNSTGTLHLDYDCTDGEVYKRAGSEKRTGTNTWKTWTVHIEDAALAGNMYRGADLRIGRNKNDEPLYLDSVTVKAIA